MFERFTERAIKVIMLAQEEARRLGHNFVGTEQLLLGLSGENTGIAAKALKANGFTLKEGRIEVENIIGKGSGFVAVEIPFTPRAKKILEFALEEARILGNNYIGTEHLLLALLRENHGVAARVLRALDIDFVKTRNDVNKMLGEKPPGTEDPSVDAYNPRNNPLLREYGSDLTKKAMDKKLDPVVGRNDEIERVIQILGRRRKNNAVLIGEPGVGKTAVVEGLAQKIVDTDVPEELYSKRIISLDLSLVVAGTKYRGEFEERLKRILVEIRKSEEIIILIDEVHTLVGAGAAEGAIDAANILKPSLARGEMQLIGATTIDEYRKHIERDAALERRFQPVLVGEPSIEESIEILMGLRGKYEDHHKLKIADEGIYAAANLSDAYVADRFLPDKAIDLIDEACSRLRFKSSKIPKEAKALENQLRTLQRSKDAAVRKQDYEQASKILPLELELKAQINAVILSVRGDKQSVRKAQNLLSVGEEEVAEIIAAWTGIPLTKLTKSESEKLLNLETTLHERVIGQTEGVIRVAKAIRRARVGLKNPNRPIASFMFAGPTGVGKTELTKAISTYFFGTDDSMVRFDMSEFMEKHTVSKLIGSPPGYIGYQEGGQLTEAVRKRPYTVVLFDEVEKAHPDVFNLMLQLLEDGILTDGKGRTVDFKNTLIIMTSNIGAKAIVDAKVSGNDDQQYKKIQGLVNDELKKFFRPEFLNRLDDVIVFRQLTRYEVSQIAEIMIKEVVKRSSEQGITLTTSPMFLKRLVNEGFDPTYGARPLRRAVTRLLEDEMAEALLNKSISPGDLVVVDADDENVYIVKQKPDSPTQDNSKDAVGTN